MALTWRIKNSYITKRMRHSALRLTYCGPEMSGSRAALPGHSPRGTLVPIETAIKRCHHLRFCGVDVRVGGSVTEA
jgi:hypothetical protein